MGLRQSPPGEGGKNRRVHFSYTPTQPLQQWHAYVAGPAKWYECHCKGRTKPCLHAVTNGELVCERCNGPDPAEPTGFLPLWRELDWRPVFVIVHLASREAVDALRHRQRVLIGRGAHASDGVYAITPPKVTGTISSTDKAKITEQDVTASLIRVWQVPALTDWYYRVTGHPEGGCNTPPKKPDVLPLFPRGTIQGEDAGDHASINDAFARAIFRAQSENGKHTEPSTDAEPGGGV